MRITKMLGTYVLLYKKARLYFTGKTRAEVIEKACWYLSNNRA